TLPISRRPHGGVIQIGNKLIKTSGGSLMIYRGKKMKNGEEEEIFGNSHIRYLLHITDSMKVKSEDTPFFLAISDRRLAIIRLGDDTCGAQFEFNDEIVDHGAITVVCMGEVEKKKKKLFRVSLNILLAFRCGFIKRIQFIVDYDEGKKGEKEHSAKVIDKLRQNDGDRMKFCAQLNELTFFGIFDDTVVLSDGVVKRAGEVSSLKKRRVTAMGEELWKGKVLMATENGSIRVVKVEGEQKATKKLNELSLLSNGQCVPPY
ncbi:hypothetical protein PENTCL1PPCAC_20015, partial [Pristionchus entomophagus]